MADSEQQVAMLDGPPVSHAQCISEHGEILTVAQTHEVHNGDMGEDILQQALDEASGDYENTDVEYTTEENMAVVADANGTLSDANGVTYSYVSAIPTETTQTLQTIQTAQPGQSLIRMTPTSPVAGVNQVVTLPTTAIPGIPIVTTHQQQHQVGLPQVVQVIKPPNVIQQQVVQTQAPEGTTQTNIIESISGPQVQQTHVQLSQTDSGTPGAITVLTNAGVGGEPLGSSANPIRIIQQGNKYTSVQQLTPEQVAQIMQVVQQQQLAQSTAQGGGSSVLFNPQTQTRIVYRVIYPSELHSKTTGSTGTPATTIGLAKAALPKTITVPTQMVTLGTVRRPYRKRLKDEEAEKVDGPELTREEKEMKKKHRPRTRSGRVSRPPKRMVQDYKHIHHLDWEEEMDDSDGGYSDYKVTDDEEEKDLSRESSLIDTSITSTKPKRFPCDKCAKAYIGAAGLARHYRLYPDHGNAEDVLPGSLGRGRPNGNGVDPMTSFADDSSTQDSISSTASLPTTTTPTPLSTCISPITATIRTPGSFGTEGTSKDGIPVEIPATAPVPVVTAVASPAKSTVVRGAQKARQQYLQENTPTRRKARLKELVRQCTDEELMEMVLPRLTRVITTWEFLLMKVERGRPSRPHIGDMLSEYEALHKQVDKTCSEYLHPLADAGEGVVERHSSVLQLTNPVLAQSLGMTTGKYGVREMPKRDDSTFQYKLLTTEPAAMNSHNIHVGSGKRTVQLVTPDELVAENPAKRVRHNEPCITSVTQSSGIVTVQMGNGVCGEQTEQQEGVETQADIQTQSNNNNTEDITENTAHMQVVSAEGDLACQDVVLEENNEHVEGSLIMSVSEEMNGVVDQDINGGDQLEPPECNIKCEDAETIISIATEHQNAPMDSEMLTSEHQNAPMDSEMLTSEPSNGQVVLVSAENPDSKVVTEDQLTGDPLEPVVDENQQVSEASTDETVMAVQQEGGTEIASEVLTIEPLPEIDNNSEVQTQIVTTDQHTQQVLSEDGQTVLFTSDGGQTFYSQAPEVDPTQQPQQLSMEVGPQIVSMETPEGLVEGQLVTNEDGTQFLIPHQEAQEQAIYQTPEGLMFIQNPDGTLRILSHGDSQIPLETALLAIDGEGQIQVDNTLEQAT